MHAGMDPVGVPGSWASPPWPKPGIISMANCPKVYILPAVLNSLNHVNNVRRARISLIQSAVTAQGLRFL